MTDKSQRADETPSAIGRYQISGTLGFGAMGTVYLAFDPLIKRTLAIKTVRLDVPRQSPQHRAFIDLFYKEARISGTLSHPNIVTLFDIGEENGVPFLVMEYVDGKTVAALLEEGVRFKAEKVLTLVSQVASALDYAHSRGVIHRDIKPSNLIVYEGEKLKVTDFGIAKVMSAEATQPGVLLGTPSYMSPEQAMGEPLDGRTDIFSLGVCAFEMLSGEQPFPGANVTSILYKLVHVDPIEPANLELNGLVPQKWRDVFNRVLAKKPESRYPTAGAFVQDLEYCLGSWFTGLGQETVTLETPAVPETTLTLAPVPATAVLVPADAAPAPGGVATVLLGPQPTPLVSASTPPDADTLVLAGEPPAAGEKPTSQAPPLGAALGGPGQGPTVVMAPLREGTATQRLPVTSPASPPLPAGRPSRPPARPGVRAGWLVGGAVGLFVVALVAVAWTLRLRAQAAAPSPEASPVSLVAPSPAPAPTLVASGRLRVESEPAGARVQVNGAPRGQTPLDLVDLPFGVYAVRLELTGYDAQAQDVSLTADSPAAQLRVNLVAAAPATGAADILSTPAGAAVSVDGQAAGTTPLSGLKLKPGPHRLEVALDGHETWSGTLDVVAGRRGRVEAQLRPLAKAKAPPTPEPVDATRVYANTPSEVDVLARKVSGDSPSYPSDRAPRLRSGERVSVLVSFLITETGDVQDVAVQESAGKTVDEVVVSAIRTWKYQPATKRGTRVRVRMLFKQTFLGG
jgi:serine/threonine-protein kinase